MLTVVYDRWCNPCKTISPLLEKLTSDDTVKTGSGRSLDLVTVDTDKQFVLALKYMVGILRHDFEQFSFPPSSPDPVAANSHSI
jgi:thiol-disulfide isomerase/thioredoxin